MKSKSLITWASGVLCQTGSNRITLLGVSRDLPTSQTMLIMISIWVVVTRQNTFHTAQMQFGWPLLNTTSKQFILFVALGPDGGDSISHQETIQCFSGWGWVWIATLSWLQDAVPHSWSVFSASRILNQALMGILPWFRGLQHSGYIRLLVWWL